MEGCRRGDREMSWTYREYYRDVLTAAKALVKIGLEPLRAVGILGFNAPEWFFSDLAGIFARYSPLLLLTPY